MVWSSIGYCGATARTCPYRRPSTPFLGGGRPSGFQCLAHSWAFPRRILSPYRRTGERYSTPRCPISQTAQGGRPGHQDRPSWRGSHRRYVADERNNTAHPAPPQPRKPLQTKGRRTKALVRAHKSGSCDIRHTLTCICKQHRHFWGSVPVSRYT